MSDEVCTCSDELEEHACPFREDVDDDSETLCTCCALCESDCAASV